MLDESLVKSIKSLPAKPGVYKFYSANDVILYIGKAKSLKARCKSYIAASVGHKTHQLMQKAVKIEYVLTANEYEALILEANLIKKHQPRYNILLRDDKSYPYVAVSKGKFPRIFLYRGKRDKKNNYFGPYANAYAVRESIYLLQKIFKLRSCSDSFFKNRSRPCLQYQIKRCSAPCVGKVDSTKYKQQVSDALRFMQGDHEQVFAELTARMEDAAAQMNYEDAAKLRDQLNALRVVQEKFVKIPGIENADIIAAAWGGSRVCVCVVMLRNSQVMGTHTYHLKYTSESRKLFWQEFLMQYYLAHKEEAELCSHIYLPQQLEEHDLYEQALRGIINKKINLKSRVPKAFAGWYEVAIANAKGALEKRLTSKTETHSRFAGLADLLQLDDGVDLIECFDVSHTYGKETVAACVAFGAYGKEKTLYRSYLIKAAKAHDDYGAMREALTRHFKHKLTAGNAMPTILLIDGGKGQINIAAEVLEDLQIQGVCLLSVVKGEGRKEEFDRVLVAPGNKELDLTKQQDVKHLLQQVRNEAHRFAITRHRKRRGKDFKKSVLDNIPGVGEKTKKSLLLHFGGMQNLKKASVTAITKVPGVGAKMAQLIYDALRNNASL